MDFRCLNSVTINDSYPLPNINLIFDTLAGSRYFNTINMDNGYCEVSMHRRSVTVVKQNVQSYTFYHGVNVNYDKQDQQGKAAFNERNPHMTQQQEPMARSPGGPQT
jgi:hypothetical protein